MQPLIKPESFAEVCRQLLAQHWPEALVSSPTLLRSFEVRSGRAAVSKQQMSRQKVRGNLVDFNEWKRKRGGA